MRAALFLTAAILTAGAAARSGGPAPTGLMCELLARPELAEISDPTPELSWIVQSAAPDSLQTAYQIRVAASEAGLQGPSGTLWDCGRVRSDRSTAVSYAGRPLEPRKSYWWQVRTWDRRGEASGWSAPQRFRTGDLRRPAPARPDDRITVTRYPLAQTPVAPVRVVEKGPGHYFLDFGRAAFAGLKLNLDSPRAGGVVVHLGEALEAPERVHRKPGGSIRYLRSEVALQPGTRSYTVKLGPKDARMLPPEIGPAMPFRYVEVENSPVPLTRESAVQVTVHYPFDDSAVRFTSSDPVLNDVWELCRYSMKATSSFGVYVDGDRERLPYEADAYINQLGHYCADREFTLARYSHEHLMLHPTWPTEWILHSPLMAWADYMHTGDAESLAEFYPDLKEKTLRALARTDGLISTQRPTVPKSVLDSVHSTRMQDIVDWPMAERDGYEMRPVNTVVNAFHFRAMELMAEIAGTLGKPDDALAFRSGAERVRRAINAKLWDPSTGLYMDGEGSTHSSIHANMFPLAFGVVPPERVPKVAAFIRSKGMACSVYGAQFLLEALYRAGQADHALALMTAKGDRSWPHMVYDVGTTITLEAWDNRYKPNQDWNHAWGAAPANIIPRLLMGIEPLEPGFRTLRIRPQPGALARASLDLPTVRGTVHADFESSPSRFALTVEVPGNTTAEVHLPRLGSGDRTVLVDGRKRRGRLEGGFLVVDRVGSGRHTFTREAQ